MSGTPLQEGYERRGRVRHCVGAAAFPAREWNASLYSPRRLGVVREHLYSRSASRPNQGVHRGELERAIQREDGEIFIIDLERIQREEVWCDR